MDLSHFPPYFPIFPHPVRVNFSNPVSPHPVHESVATPWNHVNSWMSSEFQDTPPAQTQVALPQLYLSLKKVLNEELAHLT